jgi:hypothetical protein
MSDFDDYDDLDAVRDFRTLAEPFPAEVDAVIRRRIIERADRGRPLAPAPVPTATVDADAGRAAGPEPVEAGGSLTAVVALRAPDRSRRSAVWLVAAGFLLAAMLAAGTFARRSTGTVDVGPGDGGTGPAPATTPETTAGVPGTPLTVEGLIARAAAQPDHELAPGSYQHLAVDRLERTVVAVGGGASEPAVQSTLSERWAAENQPGRWLTRMAMSRLIGGGPATSRTSQVSPPRAVEAATAFEGLSYRDLRDLPADGPGLEAAVGRRAAMLQATPPLEAYLSYLAQPVVKPTVRAALWRALAGKRLQPAGPRPAAAPSAAGELLGTDGPDVARFTLTDDAQRVWTIAVDPDTGALRSWERRDPGQDDVQVRQVVVAADVVATVGPGVIGS